MKPVAIFRHSPTEGPGYFATYLEAHSIDWNLVKIDAGEAVPASSVASRKGANEGKEVKIDRSCERINHLSSELY